MRNKEEKEIKEEEEDLNIENKVEKKSKEHENTEINEALQNLYLRKNVFLTKQEENKKSFDLKTELEKNYHISYDLKRNVNVEDAFENNYAIGNETGRSANKNCEFVKNCKKENVYESKFNSQNEKEKNIQVDVD
ncbi:hypothetical protein EDEG_01464, partial [Edhazardia aedis USNM 41457]